MGKQILAAILLIAVVLGGIYFWKKYQEDKAVTSGEVVCKLNCDTPEEKARFDKENHGETADGQSERKEHTSRQDAALIAQGGFPDGSGPAPAANSTGSSNLNANNLDANTRPTPGAVSNQNLPAPAYSPNGPAPQGNFPVASQPMTQQPMAPMAVRYPAPAGMPMSDSQMANAPNGSRFGATGNFQWYRQGNLTWRVNSVTGQTCIDFATLEEWRKMIVIEHGCGREA